MVEFLLYAKKTAENIPLRPPGMAEMHRFYDEILELRQLELARDEPPGYSGGDAKLLRRLGRYREQHLLFLSDKTVPFDNNQAGCDLRMIKAKTKISGCFRSHDGDSVFAVIKSYTSSLRKNALNIFGSIVSAWGAKPVLF